MQIRRPHKLKVNKKTYIPTQFIFFDTETYQVRKSKYSQIHKLKLGWACYWRRAEGSRPEFEKWKYFEVENDFWDFVQSCSRSKTRLVLIAHNVVFDFTVIGGWQQLIGRDWKLIRLYEKNHVFIAKYKKDSRSILLLDNMNYFATSLAKLGEQVGYKKLDIDFSKCTKEQLSKYCRRDVEILLKTWQKYFAWFMQNDLGNFGVTISSQSFNTFRHKFMKDDIFIHNRRYVLNLERQSYFGGRTECFRLGSYSTDKYYYLDVNSMYPSVMANSWYPVKYLKYDLKCSPEVLSLYLKKYCVVARVQINTKKPMFPVRKVVFNEDLYYRKIDKMWTNMLSQSKKASPGELYSQFESLTPRQSIRNWVIEKGGLRPEYINVDGKLKERQEYHEIPKYLKKRDGTFSDELAQDLVSECPFLAKMFDIGLSDFQAGEKLRYALQVEKKGISLDPPEDFVHDMLKSMKEDTIKRQQVSGKVIFPVGRFEAVLTTGELKLALAEKVIEKVISVALYKRSKVFLSFIDFFYNERLKAKAEGNIAYDTFYKLIMNSLYGKFGQQMGEWTTVGKCDPKVVEYWHEIIKDQHRVYKYRKINGLLQRYENKHEAFNSFPAVSAHVTAYARVKMWKLIMKAGRDHVYYCDTDSLFVDRQGYKNLKSEIDKSKLGKLKIEDITDDLQLLGCKFYVFGKHKKHKGRKKDAVKIGDRTYRQTRWSTLKSLIQNKNLVDYEVNDIVKHFTGIYDKGTVGKDGNVKPLVL